MPIDIDSSVSIVPGKRVFYQLEDSEIPQDVLGAATHPADIRRKSPAFIVQPLAETHAETGARQALLFVMNRYGGSFNKVARSDNSREPGSFDTYQPGDVRDEGESDRPRPQPVVEEAVDVETEASNEPTLSKAERKAQKRAERNK